MFNQIIIAPDWAFAMCDNYKRQCNLTATRDQIYTVLVELRGCEESDIVSELTEKFGDNSNV